MPRTSRRGGSTPHTPTVSAPPAARSPSPLSPERKKRADEKYEMQNLNDRLASYIERMRQQEMEIAQLNQEVSTVEETKSTEVITMRNSYNKEMAHLRKALDETSKDKAMYQIDAEKFGKENNELRNKLRDKENALNKATKEAKNLGSRLSSMQSQFDNQKSELSEANAELAKFRSDNARLEKQLADAKSNLEDETLKRIDLQNQLQTSQEGLKFENQLLEQQLNETRVRKQIEISELDGKLNQQYEEKLRKNLDDMRAAQNKQMEENRAEFHHIYDNKIKTLQDKLDKERINNSSSVQEVRELETKVTGLTSRNVELEAMHSSLQQRIADLQKELDDANKNFRNELARKDAELRSKEEQLNDLLADYTALSEIKISLDLEIQAYKTLLEGEEARLGLSPPGSPNASTSFTPSRKRKRTTIVSEDVTDLVSEHTGKGTVVIEPMEKNAKFIGLRNNTDEEVNIGGWLLTNTAASGEEVKYKFHRSTVLQPGEVCKVYSADAQEEHEPPLQLIMKRGGWVLGEENFTVLKNKNGTEEAARNSKAQRHLTGSTRIGSAQLYGQADDPENKCAIM